MDQKTTKILAIAGAAILIYSIGYRKGESHAIRELGNSTTHEALFYLAGQDYFRNRNQ